MRDAFSDEITKLAAKDPRIVLLSGDIGNRLFDKFKSQFPKRFYNCGIAEANMMSMSAGLALCGLRPVPYTIVPFITTRCFEQIRVDVCYHRLPVTIVGVGGGFSYASLNATHHSCEEIAIMRVLPNMTVICPGDAIEVRLALRAAIKHEGPVYIRLGKKGEPVVHEKEFPFMIGKGVVVRSGSDVCFLNSGLLLPTVVRAAQELEKQGISAKVVSFHTIKPLDDKLLEEVFSSYPLVVTVEEHSQIGGLGGSIAEWLTTRTRFRAQLCRIGTPDVFFYEAGGQEDAREHFGFTPSAIAERTVQTLQGIELKK